MIKHYENNEDFEIEINNKSIDLYDYNAVGDTCYVTVNGQKMTINEFRELKNRGDK